jgi:hypothetical protein
MKSNEPRASRESSLNKHVQARKAVIILGMHRSGTSALANLLIRLGGDGPATPMPPNEDNQKGHFESQQLYFFHDALLDSASSSWDDYRPIPEGWPSSPKADEFRERLRETILSEYGRSGFFVVKDPRICRIVPFWRQTLNAMKVDPLFVHTHRNPLEVAGSLQKRNGFDFDYGCLVWLRHMLDAEAGSRGQVRSFTSYDRIIKDWPEEVTKIAADLHISWPKYSIYNASEFNEIIEPGLKRQTAGVGNLRGSRVISHWISDTHSIFERWAVTGENANDHQLLDDIRGAFDESISLFHGVIQRRGQSLAAELAEINRQAAQVGAHSVYQQGVIETLTIERDAAQRHAAEISAHNVAQLQAINLLTEERDAAHGRVNEISVHNARQDEAIATLTAERDAHIEQSHLDRNKLAQSKAELDDVWQDLNSARNAFGEAERQLSNILGELEQAQAQIEALRLDNVRYENELAESQSVIVRQLGEIVAITTRQEHADREIAEAQAQNLRHEAALDALLNEKEAERAHAQEQIATAQANQAQLSAVIASLSAERDNAHRQFADAQAHGPVQEAALTALLAEQEAERALTQQQMAKAQADHAEQETVIASLSAERDDAHRRFADAQAHGQAQEALLAEQEAERAHTQQQIAESNVQYALAVAKQDDLAVKMAAREAEQAAVMQDLQAEIDRLNAWIESTIWSKISALYQDVHRKLFS